MRDHYNFAAVAIEPRVQILAKGPDTELKPNIINLIPHFHGLGSEDPFQHIQELKHLAQTLGPTVQNWNTLLMKMFPFSLKEKAAHLYRSLN